MGRIFSCLGQLGRGLCQGVYQWVLPVIHPVAYIQHQCAVLGIDYPQAQDPERFLTQLRWQLKQLKTGEPDFGDLRRLMAGEGSDFYELREYVPGDDLRKLDWHVYARTQTPHIRESMEERQMTVWLVIDFTPSMTFGHRQSKLDKAVELALCIAVLAVDAGHRLGVCWFDGEESRVIVPKGGNGHLKQAAGVLLAHKNHCATRINPLSVTTPLADVLGDLTLTIKPKSVVFMVSDFLEDGVWQPLFCQLAHQREVYALGLTDDTERDPFCHDTVGALTDLESGESCRFPGVNEALIDEYTRQYQAFLTKTMERLQWAAGVQWVSTATAVEALFQKTSVLPLAQRRTAGR